MIRKASFEYFDSLSILQLASRSLRILYSCTGFLPVLMVQRKERKEAMIQVIGKSRDGSASKLRVIILWGVTRGRYGERQVTRKQRPLCWPGR